MSEDRLVLSPSLTYHHHHGNAYVYHNRVGYLLKMGPDVLLFLEAFRTPMSAAEAVVRFDGLFTEEMVRDYLGAFQHHLCVLSEGDDELDHLWAMYPARSPWAICHEPPEDSGQPARFVHAGPGDELHDVEMHGWERSLWELIDGNRSLTELAARMRAHPALGAPGEGTASLVSDAVARWVRVEVQAVRLSESPVSVYRRQPHLRQPYLTSVMPYPRLSAEDARSPAVPLEDARTLHPLGEFAPDEDHEGEKRARPFGSGVGETFAFLFREPHPALRGATFAERLAQTLVRNDDLPDPVRDIVAVGGTPSFAREILRAVDSGQPGPTSERRCRILDRPPLPVLAAEPHDDRISCESGDAEKLDLPDESVDLLLGIEIARSLSVERLTRDDLGLGHPPVAAMRASLERNDEDAPPPNPEERLAALGETGALILRYRIPLGDAPWSFYLNTGLYRFLENAWRVLRPGGTVVLTELGEEHEYPRLSFAHPLPELTVHWGFAKHVARRLGFDTAFTFLTDLLEVDTAVQVVATSGSSFRALTALAERFGVHLRRLPYTEEMLRAAFADQLSIEDIGGLRFEPVAQRCMDLSPQGLKALVLRKPREAG